MPRSSGRSTKAASNPSTATSTATSTTRSATTSRKRDHSPAPNSSPEPLDNSNNTRPQNKKKKKQQQPAVDVGGGGEEDDEDEDDGTPGQVSLDVFPSEITTSPPLPVQRGVPAFLNKLYSMVDDSATDSLIRWSADGASFIVERHELFAKTILPRFYKHNTFASFVRQLNMYDFHKIPAVQQGVLFPDTEREIWEFSHANFRRGRQDLLMLVTRKRKDKGDGDPDSMTLTSVVKQISSIRSHQLTISQDLRTLQQDNSILWQESLAAREKHQRHQDVIEKILQFLTAVFSSEYNLLAASTAQLNGPFMLGKNNEYISLLNKEQLESSGRKLDSILPTALIKEAASLAGLPKFPDAPTGNLGQEYDSMGRCTPNTGILRMTETLAAILSLSYSISSCNTSKAGSGDPSSVASSSSSQAPPPQQQHKQMQASVSSPQQQQPQLQQQPNHHRHPSPPAYPDFHQYQEHDFLSQDSHRDIETFKQTVDTATRSAEAISNDIDDLQFDIESLAATIGLDATQFNDTEFTSFEDQDMFSGGNNGMIASATRNEKIQLYQLAGGSHILNKYDTSQSSKGKAVVTPISVAAGTAAALNLSASPFIGGSQPVATPGTAASVPTPQAASPPPLPTAAAQSPMSDVSGTAGAPGGQQGLGGAMPSPHHPHHQSSQERPQVPPQLLNLGVSPLLSTLFHALSARSSGNNADLSAFDPRRHAGAPQQNPAANATARATAAPTAAPATPNSSSSSSGGGGDGLGENFLGAHNTSGANVAGIPGMFPPKVMTPQAFQQMYPNVPLPPGASAAGHQFVPVPVPVPVAVPIHVPTSSASSTPQQQTQIHQQFSSPLTASTNPMMNPYLANLYNAHLQHSSPAAMSPSSSSSSSAAALSPQQQQQPIPSFPVSAEAATAPGVLQQDDGRATTSTTNNNNSNVNHPNGS